MSEEEQTDVETDLNMAEKQQFYDQIGAIGAIPLPEEKFNVHTFLHKVATANDTTKIGNLTEEELGTLKHPIRTHKSIALICKNIIGNDFLAKYFEAESEIATSTSLSRNGFLIKSATTTTRQIADVTKPRKVNKGWFKKKEPEGEQQ